MRDMSILHNTISIAQVYGIRCICKVNVEANHSNIIQMWEHKNSKQVVVITIEACERAICQHLRVKNRRIWQKHTRKDIQDIIMCANRPSERTSFQYVCCNNNTRDVVTLMTIHAQYGNMVAHEISEREIVQQFRCNA